MSERNGMSHEDAARLGGKVSIKIMGAKARAKHVANRAKAKSEKAAAKRAAESPPAPLPPWLAGDKTGLPMKPPGRRET